MIMYKTHGKYQTKMYKAWRVMVDRCAKGKYLDEGIKVCERWLVFENFASDMGERPLNHVLDRIDNTKGYSPENCRWATYAVSNQNRRLGKRNKTGYRGVSFNKKLQKFVAHICYDSKDRYLGAFSTAEEAARAYDAAASEAHGSEAKLNFLLDNTLIPC